MRVTTHYETIQGLSLKAIEPSLDKYNKAISKLNHAYDLAKHGQPPSPFIIAPLSSNFGSDGEGGLAHATTSPAGDKRFYRYTIFRDLTLHIWCFDERDANAYIVPWSFELKPVVEMDGERALLCKNMWPLLLAMEHTKDGVIIPSQDPSRRSLLHVPQRIGAPEIQFLCETLRSRIAADVRMVISAIENSQPICTRAEDFDRCMTGEMAFPYFVDMHAQTEAGTEAVSSLLCDFARFAEGSIGACHRVVAEIKGRSCEADGSLTPVEISLDLIREHSQPGFTKAQFATARRLRDIARQLGSIFDQDATPVPLYQQICQISGRRGLLALSDYFDDSGATAHDKMQSANRIQDLIDHFAA